MTTDPGFDLFLGIDWSGAKGSRNKGIQVAAAAPGTSLPELQPNPYREHGIWSRPDVLTFIDEMLGGGRRVLAGFDFAFSYPFEDVGAYFPGLEDAPETVDAVWELVEEVAADDPNLYGAALYQRDDLPYRDYFIAPGWHGELYSDRLRETEHVTALTTRPYSVFTCNYATNVGTGSLAGMRVLHRLRQRSEDVRIWPFDPQPGGALTVVEIFPRLFFKRVGGDPRAWGDRDNLMKVCAAYGCDGGALPEMRTEDEADAVISAAALKELSGDPVLWQQSRRAGAAKEGWIFGAA